MDRGIVSPKGVLSEMVDATDDAGGDGPESPGLVFYLVILPLSLAIIVAVYVGAGWAYQFIGGLLRHMFGCPIYVGD
ncbi:MAG: hypothetical protein PVJ27_01815 [Candidatus Brocadiaceae bacterium]|jgi:hypothetical protein